DRGACPRPAKETPPRPTWCAVWTCWTSARSGSACRSSPTPVARTGHTSPRSSGATPAIWPESPQQQRSQGTMEDNVNDFLFSTGVKAARFETIGDMTEGLVTEAKLTQQTSLDDNTPLTWPDGRAKMQLVGTVQTTEHDDEDDDGLRRLYAKGGRYEAASGSGSSMKDAIADAVRKAGGKTLEEGARLRVAYTGEGKKTNRGYSAPKLYKASYEAP